MAPSEVSPVLSEAKRRPLFLPLSRLLEVSAKQGWSIVALDLNLDTSTPTGKLVASIMAGVGQQEREVIGLRTKEVAAAKAKGVRIV